MLRRRHAGRAQRRASCRARCEPACTRRRPGRAGAGAARRTARTAFGLTNTTSAHAPAARPRRPHRGRHRPARRCRSAAAPRASTPRVAQPRHPRGRLRGGPGDEHAHARGHGSGGEVAAAPALRSSACAACSPSARAWRVVGTARLGLGAQQRRERLRRRGRARRRSAARRRCQRACAASGMLQLPPSARDTARSACTASQVGAVRQRRQQLRAASCASARTSMPSAPCPAAGSICARLEAARGCAPPGRAASGRRRPARSRRTGLRRACAAGCRGCRAAARPRRSGRSARSCASRRRLEVPTTRARRQRRPGWRSGCETKASRGSSRSSTAASTKPAGRSIGTSFSECTARCGAAVHQRRLEFLDEQALAADLGQRAVEDLVAARGHAEQLDAAGRSAARSRSRTCSACHRARRLSRVAMMMGSVMAEMLAGG